MSSRRPSPEAVLLLLAHNDDEYFASGAIVRELDAGNEVYVVHTTHGSVTGVPSGVREAETLAALRRLGIPASRVRNVGRESGTGDGRAIGNLLRLRVGARDAFPAVRFARVLTVAWEGGHPDHDVTHLIALALAREWRIPLFEFPLYTQLGAPRPLHRTMRLAPGRPGDRSFRIPVARRFRLFLLFRCYPSQWRTFVGLLPEASWRLLVQGIQPLRAVDTGVQPTRPHDGPLYYEGRFATTYDALVAAFRELTGSTTDLRGGPA